MQQLTAESAGAVVVCCGFTGDRDAGSSAAQRRSARRSERPVMPLRARWAIGPVEMRR